MEKELILVAMKYKVSIIVPVYNVQRYLSRCLDSLLLQTLSEIEIICVDDGSSDDSPRIIEEYKARDSRVRMIHQQNAGVSAARNAGIDCATAPYIMFCDSDDEYAPEMAEKLYRVMIQSNCDFGRCGVQLFGEQGCVNVSESCFNLPFVGDKILLTEDTVLTMDSVVWNKIFRRDVIVRYGIKFPEGLRYEDTCFYWKYAIVSKEAALVKSKLYQYRLHGDSFMSSSGSDRLLDYIRNMEDIREFMERNDLWNVRGGLFLKIFVRTFDLVFRSITLDRRDACYNLSSSILKKIGEFKIRSLINGEYFAAMTSILKYDYFYYGTRYIKICGVKIVKSVCKLGRREIRVLGMPIYIRKCK